MGIDAATASTAMLVLMVRMAASLREGAVCRMNKNRTGCLRSITAWGSIVIGLPAGQTNIPIRYC